MSHDRLDSCQKIIRLVSKSQQGKFARQWMSENKRGGKKYQQLLNKDLKHKIEKVGVKLRERMPWLQEQA